MPTKDEWEYCDVIPLLSLLGVNHIHHILNMSKTIVCINIIEKYTNIFAYLIYG